MRFLRRLGTVFLLMLPASLPPALHGREAAAAPPEITIERIEITGSTSLSRPEIEGSLEIGPGDRLERVRVIRTAENLQALYNSRGFEQVSIQTRLLRNKNPQGEMESVLEFNITEGLPTRIAEIRFVSENLRDAAFQRYWSRMAAALSAQTGVVPGDLFDQTKIAATKRTLQDMLASEEFIGAKVDDIRVSAVPAPKQLPGGAPPAAAARWITLEYHVDLGDRVTFGFRGFTVFPHSRLSALVQEQRLVGFGKDYIPAVRTRIEDEYRALGYAQVKVTPYTFEKPASQERHVTYVIEEGPRVTIETITFDGNNVFSRETLRAEFFRQAPLQVQLGYYVAADVARAAELMVEWMKSKGYLSAKLVTINPAEIPGKAGVRLTVYLFEGDQTIVRDVRINGAKLLTPAAIAEILGIRENEPLNPFVFTEGLEALKAEYRAQGYLSMMLANEHSDEVVRYSQENRSAEIRLDIVEGPQYRANRIFAEGQGRTREEVILRELVIREGDVITESAISESEARLRRLGLFSIVSIRTLDDPADPNGKIVRVSVQEGTPGVLAGGFGFRNDQGVRIFGQAGYGNLLGKNHTISLGLTANRRLENYRFVEGEAQLAYRWPWFLNRELTFRPTFTISSTQYLTFATYSTALAATWEKKLSRSLSGLFTWNLEQIKQFNAVDDLDNQVLQIGTFAPAVQLDLRDNPLSPSSGLYSAASFEMAGPFALSQTDPFPVGYTRFQFRSDGYIPLSNQVTWFLSFRTGIERNSEAPREGQIRSGAIPAVKTFTLGGPSSVRGFKEQALNLYNYTVRGTASYVNYRTQLDLPFSGALRFGPFLDAANLLLDRYSLGIDMRYGAGMGFHYQTPVGPVNLDWGFNLAPRDGEDYWRFHFSIGVI